MRKTRHVADRDGAERLGRVIDLAIARATPGRCSARTIGVTTTTARTVLDSRQRGAAGVDAKAASAEDPWVDEYQWLAGFPSNWGDRGGGWFRGF
jgi:hypothetical protein